MIEKLLESMLNEKKNLKDFTRDSLRSLDRANLLINYDEILKKLDEELMEDESKKINYKEILYLVLLSVFIYNMYKSYNEEGQKFIDYKQNQEKIKSDLNSGNIPKTIESRFKEHNIAEYETIGRLIEYISSKDDLKDNKRIIYEDLRILVQNDNELNRIINESEFSSQEMLTYMTLFIYNIIKENKNNE